MPQSASNFSWNPTTDLTNYTSLHPIASPQVTTTYTLTTSDPNCTSTATAAVSIIDCKLMDADAASSEAHIYPNPGDTEIRIELMTESADDASILLTVTNLEGKNLIQKNVMSRNGKAEAVIDVSELASGSYLLIVDGSEQAIPFVVSH